MTGALPPFTWQDEVGTPSLCPRPGPHQQGAPTPDKSVVAEGQWPHLAEDSSVADTARRRPMVSREEAGAGPEGAPAPRLVAEGGGGSSCPGCSVRRVPDHTVVQAPSRPKRGAHFSLPWKPLSAPTPGPRALLSRWKRSLSFLSTLTAESAHHPHLSWPSPPQGGNKGTQK